jgi:hypothetical protein
MDSGITKLIGSLTAATIANQPGISEVASIDYNAVFSVILLSLRLQSWTKGFGLYTGTRVCFF